MQETNATTQGKIFTGWNLDPPRPDSGLLRRNTVNLFDKCLNLIFKLSCQVLWLGRWSSRWSGACLHFHLTRLTHQRARTPPPCVNAFLAFVWVTRSQNAGKPAPSLRLSFMFLWNVVERLISRPTPVLPSMVELSKCSYLWWVFPLIQIIVVTHPALQRRPSKNHKTEHLHFFADLGLLQIVWFRPRSICLGKVVVEGIINLNGILPFAMGKHEWCQYS